MADRKSTEEKTTAAERGDGELPEPDFSDVRSWPPITSR